MTFPMEKNYDKLFPILKHLVLKEKKLHMRDPLKSSRPHIHV